MMWWCRCGSRLRAAAAGPYRDGAEAALRHLERAIEWHAAFEAHRRTLVERRQAEFVTDEQQRLGVEFPEDRFDGVGVAPCLVIEPCLDEFLVNCFIFPIVALLVAELVVGAALVAHARICARLVGNGHLYRDK